MLPGGKQFINGLLLFWSALFLTIGMIGAPGSNAAADGPEIKGGFPIQLALEPDELDEPEGKKQPSAANRPGAKPAPGQAKVGKILNLFAG